MADTVKQLSAEYERLSEDFTELNKKYNRAQRTDTMTDELELAFLRAEKDLHAAYAARQAAKMED